jgi:hypothetical protein
LGRDRNCFGRRLAVLTTAWLLASGGTLVAQVQYVEVGSAVGILPYSAAAGMGAGVAAADFDDDGDIDLFVPNAKDVPDQLYRNLGNGLFEEIASDAGVDSLERNRAALWFDYDGDNLLDLVVAGDCYQSVAVPPCPDVSPLRLYRQTSVAVFEDVTVSAGIVDGLIPTVDSHRGGLAAGDINNDGWLDLLIGLWYGEAVIFVNDGDGTFTRATGTGIDGLLENHWQPVMFDIDGDGWLDIVYAIDYLANRLWINQRDGTFLDQATVYSVDNAMNDMGVTLGDYDNDGDLDIYVTNIFSDTTYNVLYRNHTASLGYFIEVATALGVDDGSWGWGATFFDADNSRGCISTPARCPSRLPISPRLRDSMIRFGAAR